MLKQQIEDKDEAIEQLRVRFRGLGLYALGDQGYVSGNKGLALGLEIVLFFKATLQTIFCLYVVMLTHVASQNRNLELEGGIESAKQSEMR